ncbi:MAG: hypothetical protein ACOC3J_05565 [Gemmatimonadota bacterium]
MTGRGRWGIAAALALGAVVMPAPEAGAQQVRIGDGAWADFGLFLQMRGDAAVRDGASGHDLTADYALSMVRGSVRGQIVPGLGFFVASGGDPNFGSFEIWDAALSLRATPWATVDAGRVLLPFVRHAQQFSNDLPTREFHRSAFMYPKGSALRRRDAGVRVRGVVGDGRLDYRVAVTRGMETEEGLPRLTGRVGLNGGEPEAGYVFPGMYLGGPEVVATGVAFDYQPGVVGGDAYYALGADVFWNVPVRGADRVQGQAAVVRYHGLNGRDPANEPVVVDRTGVGALLDASYLEGAVGPLVAVEWFRPEGARDLDRQLLAVYGGVNWWVRGSALALKLQGGMRKEPGLEWGDAHPSLTLQLQTRLPFPPAARRIAAEEVRDD